MILRWTPSLFVLGLVALAAGCSAPSARFHAGYMQAEITGSLGLAPSTPGAGVTADVDVEDALGLTDPSGTVHARAELDAGPIRLTASGFRYSQDGQGQLTASFGDITAGTSVASDLDFTNVKAALTFDVIDTGVVRISPGVAVDLFIVDASVTDSFTSTTETVDELMPVPMLFAQAEVDVGPVAGTVDVGFLDVDLGETAGTYLDVEAMLAVQAFETVEFYAGYRYISLDAEGTSGGQNMTADLLLRGWFVGGGVHF